MSDEVICMTTTLDQGRLIRLINDLHLCTGIKFALLNAQGQELYSSSYRTDFCTQVMQSRIENCYACDRNAVDTVMKTRRPYRYICHAGLYEVAIPVLEGEELIAIILFGQMLDDAPRDQQWERILRKCAWEGDVEGLHQAFLRLRRVSSEQMDACAEIARTCVSEVRLRSMNDLGTLDDATRLRQYIEAHYADRLTADSLAGALHIGKTKLYALCQQRYNVTPMQLVVGVRMNVAKDLLRSTRESVAVIARAVGYEDQNYFTKVFRKAAGQAPAVWRRRSLEQK